MCQKFTPDELNSMNHDARNEVIYQMQDRLDRLEPLMPWSKILTADCYSKRHN